MSDYILSEEILGNEEDWRKMRNALERKGMEVPPNITRGSWASLVDNLDVGGDVVLVEDLPIGFRNYMSFPVNKNRMVTSTGRVFLQENGEILDDEEFPILATLPGTNIIFEETSFVPIMTSDTTPYPFVAEASSIFGAARAYRMFDGMTNEDNNSWTTSSNVLTAWGRIKLDEPKKVSKIILSTPSVSYLPTTITFFGSDDGIAMDDIADVTQSASATVTHIIPTLKKYLYYGLRIYKESGIMRISELQLFGAEFRLPETPKDAQGRAMWVLAN